MIHTIDDFPNGCPYNNPYIGIICETSILPKFILVQDYQEYVKRWNSKEFNRNGTLTGWFYVEELLTHEDRLRMIHIAAEKNYYRDLDL